MCAGSLIYRQIIGVNHSLMSGAEVLCEAENMLHKQATSCSSAVNQPCFEQREDANAVASHGELFLKLHYKTHKHTHFTCTAPSDIPTKMRLGQ
jgi:hypothetical protein